MSFSGIECLSLKKLCEANACRVTNFLSNKSFGLCYLPCTVELRLMNADGSDDHRLLTFFGGQGSINVNSWAADSRHIAFVSYELLHK